VFSTIITGVFHLQSPQVIRQNRVLNTIRQENGMWLVETEKGNWECEIIVNAAGCYARQVGQWVGLDLPILNMTHHYLVTEPVEEFVEMKERGEELPVVRDDRLVSGYIRMEQDAGLIGIYEKANSNSVWEEFTPWELSQPLFDADYDRIEEWLMNAFDRMPMLAEKGIQKVIHGAPECSNLSVIFQGCNYWANPKCIGTGFAMLSRRDALRTHLCHEASKYISFESLNGEKSIFGS